LKFQSAFIRAANCFSNFCCFEFPGWLGIFIRHIDKKNTAFEWSVYDVITGDMVLAATLGVFMVDL